MANWSRRRKHANASADEALCRNNNNNAIFAGGRHSIISRSASTTRRRAAQQQPQQLSPLPSPEKGRAEAEGGLPPTCWRGRVWARPRDRTGLAVAVAPPPPIMNGGNVNNNHNGMGTMPRDVAAGMASHDPVAALMMPPNGDPVAALMMPSNRRGGGGVMFPPPQGGLGGVTMPPATFAGGGMHPIQPPPAGRDVEFDASSAHHEFAASCGGSNDDNCWCCYCCYGCGRYGLGRARWAPCIF